MNPSGLRIIRNLGEHIRYIFGEFEDNFHRLSWKFGLLMSRVHHRVSEVDNFPVELNSLE